MVFVIILFAIALQVFLTVKKISPFLSLLVVAIVSGLLLGMEPSALLASIEKGVGSTLGGLALIVCLGAILGKILETSGAAEQISGTLINGFGEKNIQWAVLLTGFLIGIPLYYNAGFVILVPLVFSIARRTGLPLLYIVMPMAASLSTTHCFLPPHPGPVVLVNAFHADMGKTLMYGLLIAVPAVLISGPLLGRVLKNTKAGSYDLFGDTDPVAHQHLPSVLSSFCIALMPVALISMSVIGNLILEKDNMLRRLLAFSGDSTIALLLAVIAAIYFFGLRINKTMPQVMQWASDAISGIAVILLTITAGGVFKQVLIDSGTGSYISSFSSTLEMPPLLFAWILTALLRVTMGSATVAGLTAAGIVSPLVVAGNVSPELMVLAVGAGSVFGSHINDSGFWMYKEFFRLSLKETFLSWTVMETLISLIGLAGILVLQLFIR
ncbi:MAG: gluconate transporter [Chitinophagaceae bacterium]|nr:gluconate transporter [Chitinophagaceae bacterium]MCA6456437.1 gluconate transporter [Chitinophagaceae bacterium]MCA6460177.1 gluconate transporter [Chitinophagaceae bacterium]MCA6465998.1 gluconate transporter [Chitinophagaceae bacterium]